MSVASILFVVFAMGFLTSPDRTGVEASRLETAKEPCCFQNPGYAGTCKVEPAEDETCAGILAYLNNPMAEGKSYCGGTTVRRGFGGSRLRGELEEERFGDGLPLSLLG